MTQKGFKRCGINKRDEKKTFQLKDLETLLNVSSIVLSLITHTAKIESRVYSHEKLVCVPGILLLYNSSTWDCDLAQNIQSNNV